MKQSKYLPPEPSTDLSEVSAPGVPSMGGDFKEVSA
jgi:hypothetical protein